MNVIAFARKFWWIWPPFILIAAVLLTRMGYISDSYEGFLVYPLIPIAFNAHIFMGLTCFSVPALIIGFAIVAWLRKINSPSLQPELGLIFAFGFAYLAMGWSAQSSLFYSVDIDYELSEYTPNGQTYYLTHLSASKFSFDSYSYDDMAIILLECDSLSVFCRKIIHANYKDLSFSDFESDPPQLYLYRNNTLSLKYGGETIFEKRLADE